MVANTMVMERTGVTGVGVTVPGVTTPTVGTPTNVPVGGNFVMVPRCTFTFEKCTGGVKINCVCEDKVAATMVQNLCNMLTGGMVGCYVTMNGVQVCTVNFTMGICKCEVTDTGVCITCTSGDATCCNMIQACSDCVACMVTAGCTCCVTINGTPVCCGTTRKK
jgi:hypothetical protein